MTEALALSEKLRLEGRKVREFFSGMQPDDWSARVYADGELWTVRSVLAHMMTAERGLLSLFRRIQRGGSGVSDDFRIDTYNASQQRKTAEAVPDELLRKFGAVRAEVATWVAGLSDADLAKEGRHPFLGIVSLREMIKMLYIHDLAHCRDIRRVIGGK
jgi:DinB family protein